MKSHVWQPELQFLPCLQHLSLWQVSVSLSCTEGNTALLTNFVIIITTAVNHQLTATTLRVVAAASYAGWWVMNSHSHTVSSCRGKEVQQQQDCWLQGWGPLGHTGASASDNSSPFVWTGWDEDFTTTHLLFGVHSFLALMVPFPFSPWDALWWYSTRWRKKSFLGSPPQQSQSSCCGTAQLCHRCSSAWTFQTYPLVSVHLYFSPSCLPHGAETVNSEALLWFLMEWAETISWESTRQLKFIYIPVHIQISYCHHIKSISNEAWQQKSFMWLWTALPTFHIIPTATEKWMDSNNHCVKAFPDRGHSRCRDRAEHTLPSAQIMTAPSVLPSPLPPFQYNSYAAFCLLRGIHPSKGFSDFWAHFRAHSLSTVMHWCLVSLAGNPSATPELQAGSHTNWDSRHAT